MPGSILTLDYPEADVAVLTINDPAKGANVLSRSVLADFEALLDEVEKRKNVAGLIIRSTKPGNFIAGADLREFLADIHAPREKIVEISRRGHHVFGRLSKLPFVSIAAIDGLCLGGGSEMAVWCDRRLMAANQETSFGFPEVKLGLFPGWGGTARLPRIVGLSNAVEMITGGESVDPATAYAMGLADVVYGSGDSLIKAAIALVRREQTTRQYLADRQLWSGPIAISETELAFLGATASAFIQGQTKGFYPAPLAALETMLGAAGVDVDAACQMEAEGFAPLFGSPVNRALLNVFFLRDGNKKTVGVPADAKPREVKTAAVIGAGVMGQGIASANVKRRIPVALGDISPDAVGRGVQGVLTEASYNKQTKGPDPKKMLELAPLVNGTTVDAELAASDIVVEAIFENADAKRKLYARLEPSLAANATLCTNTSTIPVTELAAGLKRPENFCGLHFFNPVRMMPLVEVIRGAKTSDATVATAVAYARRLGKNPIVVADGPGFLVNRVLLPYMNEALLLLEEGAQIKHVDRAATAFGMPMGPITLYDTVGLDVALHAGGVMQRAFPDRVVPSTILPAMVEAGRLGKKVGRGFFDYGGKKKDRGEDSPEAAAIIEKQRRGTKKFSPDEITDRLVLPMLLEATRVLEDGVAQSVRDVDLALIMGIGFPPFLGGLFFWADTIGAKAVVEKLKSYDSLGKRFAPTRLLTEKASTNAKFYQS